MEQIIIIRIADSDDQVFQKILNVLADSNLPAKVIDTSELSFPGLKICIGTGNIVRNGKVIPLNRNELTILSRMASNPGRVFSKDQLYYALYSEQPYNSNAITTAIHRLRSKVEPDPQNPTYIKTVRGLGYKFDPPKEG